MSEGVITDFINGLDQSTSIDESFSALSSAIEALGFNAIAYTYIPQGQALSSYTPIFLASEHFSHNFLNHYQEADLVQHDFTVKRISNGYSQVMSWQQELQQQTLSADEGNLVQLARYDYGINNAISIPLQSDANAISGASILSEESDGVFDILTQEQLHHAKLITQLFHQHVQSNIGFKKYFYQNILNHLTNDEKRVLKFVIQGRPFKQSQDICGISPSYAANICSRLMRKWDVKNSAELSHIAGVHHLIEMF